MRAAIGLGSNIGNSARTLERAVKGLRNLGSVRAISSLYRSEPWGVTDQPEFLNAVALLDTGLPPRDLLTALQRLERELGRTPTYRWGPRVIDMDILYYGDATISDADLEIPHPRMGDRAFVLVPLAEIDERYTGAAAALPDEERRKVQALRKGEWVALMSDEQQPRESAAGLIDRVRALAGAFVETDLVRMRIEEPNEDAIEFRRTVAVSPAVTDEAAETTQAEAPRGRVDAIKSDIVGVIRLGRPAPTEGETLSTDRELAYVEALGIRTGVRSLGPGRLVAVRIEEGQPVEYGQILFEIDRG